ncbi:MAG: hypothetical protein LBF86_00320 [Helicobacteraceae bacterium]|jgi:hypothetical protein|nr:hypothetical protein [Helicobacteraceae bacterium]
MEINAVGVSKTPYASVQTPLRTFAEQTRSATNLSETQKNVKERSDALKSDNDLFGAVKTLERSLGDLKATALKVKNGEIDRVEAQKIIADRVENTRYKNENLYENFPLKDASAINAREQAALGENADEYIKTIDAFIKENANALSEVKSRLLGETKRLGDLAQKSYEQSGLDAINPSNIVASTDADYLKTQFAKLTR